MRPRIRRKQRRVSQQEVCAVGPTCYGSRHKFCDRGACLSFARLPQVYPRARNRIGAAGFPDCYYAPLDVPALVLEQAKSSGLLVFAIGGSERLLLYPLAFSRLYISLLFSPITLPDS